MTLKPSSPAAAPACHRTLYTGALMSIADWRCGGVDMPDDAVTDAFEIIVVRHGSFLRRCKSATIMAEAGTALLWRPEEVYRITHPRREPDCCSAFVLSEASGHQLLEVIAPKLLDGKSGGCQPIPLSVATYVAHRRALGAAAAGGCPAAIEETASVFMEQALHSRVTRDPPGRSSRARDYCANVRAIISDRFAEPLSLHEIGLAVGCSPFHLSRLFRAVEGETIHGALVRARLRASLDWLLDTNHDVSRIALAVGFASHSHLTAAFRREFGMTPTSARAQLSRGASTDRER